MGLAMETSTWDMSAPDPDQPVTDAADADAARAGTPPTRAVLWFRSVVAHAPDLLAVLDRAGVVKYVSPSAEPLLGYSPDELGGPDAWPRSPISTLAPIAHALASSRACPIFIEGGLRHRDGTMRAFEGNVTNLLADPVVHGYRRQRARCHRPARRRRPRAGGARWRCARSCRRRRSRSSRSTGAGTCTSGTSRASRCSAGPRPTSSAAARRSPREELDVQRLVEGAFAGDTDHRLRSEHHAPRRTGGRVQPRDRAAARQQRAAPSPSVVIVADVTEQKRAQRAVEASEARFRSLVQHLTDMILVLEDDGTIAYVSPSASAFIGIEPDDAHRVVAAGGPGCGRRTSRALGEMFQKLRAHARYESRRSPRDLQPRRRRVPVGRDDRREPAARPGGARHRHELPRHHRPRRCGRRDPRQ